MCDKGAPGRLLFRGFNAIVLTAFALACLCPLWHLLMVSVSDPELLAEHQGPVFFPLTAEGKRVLWSGYRAVLQNSSVWRGLANSLFYVGTGTLLHVALCAVAAYCISRRQTLWMRYLAILLVFTIFFNGGLVPTYMVNRWLGLYNTRWVVVAMGLLPVLHVAYVSGAMRALPRSLEESAQLDGAGACTILANITLPLVKSSLMVVALFYAVGKWNEYLTPVLYLQNRKLFPLPLIVRGRLIDAVSWGYDQKTEKLMSYSLMVLSTLPLLCLSVFVKKHLEKGVMLGAVKG